MTPYERWKGVKPNLKHVRQFGATAFAIIPAKQRQKLDDKARKLTFVGYPEGTKGFRVLNTTTQKIYICEDVNFFEGNPHKNQRAKDIVHLDNLDQRTPKEFASQKSNVTVVIDSVTELKGSESSIAVSTEEGEQTQADPRRSLRINKGRAPKRLIEHMNKVTVWSLEPRTFKEAVMSFESDKWQEAMNEEIHAQTTNMTWSLVKLPKGKSVVGSIWVYKMKQDEDGKAIKYKARLVVQGYSQRYGQGYDEIFAPMAKSATLRLSLTIAGHKQMRVKHFDIETTYLNGDLAHEVYIKRPEGYEDQNKKLVYKLNKKLYGLKQGAKEWSKRLNDVLIKEGFIQSANNLCLYYKLKEGDWIYISVHVDDMIVAAIRDQLISEFEKEMNKSANMMDLGNLKYYLGLQFECDKYDYFTCIRRNTSNRNFKNITSQTVSHQKFRWIPGIRRNSHHQKR